MSVFNMCLIGFCILIAFILVKMDMAGWDSFIAAAIVIMGIGSIRWRR